MCASCPVGHFCPAGAPLPVPCPGGHYSDKPNLGNVSDCIVCLPGYMCMPGSDTPTRCSMGSYAGAGQDLCSMCEAGSYQDEEGQSSCKDCPAGNDCPRGSTVPLPASCLPGMFASNITDVTSRDDCQPCADGFECPGGDAQPRRCRPGTKGPPNRTISDRMDCALCSGGSYQDSPGATACISCVAGSYCPVGSASPLPCLRGSFSNATNLTRRDQCTPTDPGFFAATGSVEQVLCASGTIAPTGQLGACEPCAPGSFQNAIGETACLNCTGGHFCQAGAPTPVPCERGTFGNRLRMQSAEECIECPKGASCVVGSTEPQYCLPGTYSPVPGRSNCTACPAGYYANASGATGCTECSPGHCVSRRHRTQCDGRSLPCILI